MKSEDITLVLIFIFAVLISGFLADHLRKEQVRINPSRDQVSRLPLAGFHKFAADVEWGLFLHYLGDHELNLKEAPKVKEKVLNIVNLDPDFGRVYYEGALMLAPVDPESALAILEKGIEHPTLKNYWRLHMLAGLILMRPERMNHLAGKEMDEHKVSQARDKFAAARKCPGGAGALGNLIFAEAYLNYVDDKQRAAKGELVKGDDDDGAGQPVVVKPLLVYELEKWLKEWEKMRTMYEGFLETGVSGSAPPASMTGFKASAVSRTFDINQKILHLLRKVRDTSPDYEGLEELTTTVTKQVFQDTRFDFVDLSIVGRESVELIAGTVETPGDKEYVLRLNCPYPYTVLKATLQQGSGSAKVTLTIDDVDVDGLASLEVGTEPVSEDSVGNHLVNPGQTLKLVVSECEEPADLAYAIETCRK